MAILTPDVTVYMNGVNVNQYFLTKHNPNKISMPTGRMDNIIGVTIHNTDWIAVASNTTPAEQYTRATVNGNMNDVRVHYYVDHKCAWQNLPLPLQGWHAADGNGDGNTKTIAIECIMGSTYNDTDKKSEDICAKLAAALLVQYNLKIENLYTHNHWYSKKYCPAYILPHWETFRATVQKYMNQLKGSTTPPKPASSMTEKEMFDYFKSQGYTDYGTAGLMGNLYAESGLKSNNLQDTGNTKLNMTDDQYTSAVDTGSYTNFVNDGQGYGLAQWTYYSRKQSLLDYAKSKNVSIGDTKMQCEFIVKELGGYSSLTKILKSAKNVKEASDAVLEQYERPANMTDAVKIKRALYAQEIYDRCVVSATGKEQTKYYRIRKSWDNASSQLGAFSSLDNAKEACKEGYNVYDWNGKLVYSPTSSKTFTSYTVSLNGSDKVYSDGTGQKATGTVGEDGVYTIIAEQISSGIKYGKLKSGIGWVKVENKTPISSTVNKVIAVGDKVKVLNNIQYNGQTFKIYESSYYVMEINGDRVVISADNKNTTCAINIKNLQKV